MRIDKLYETLLMLHAFLPYKLGNGFAFPLLRVTFELTHQCNLRCTFCFQKEQKGKREKDELSADEFIRFISQLSRYTIITFTGGEPFVKKDALEIVKYALEKHGCNIITNGVMLTEAHVQTFVDKRLLLIGVSIDGVGHYHDQLRGMKGAFVKINDNLQLLQRYKNSKKTKYPLLDIKTVITQENVDTLEEIYQYALDIGADFFTLSPFKVTNIQFQPNFINDLHDSRLWSPPQVTPYVDVNLLVKKISNIVKNSSNKKTKIRLYPATQAPEGIETHFDNSRKLADRYKPCLIPWSGVLIAPTGDAYPCIAYKVGNIRESSLSSIWNTARYREFRKCLRSVGLFPACAGCCYLKERPHASLN